MGIEVNADFAATVYRSPTVYLYLHDTATRMGDLEMSTTPSTAAAVNSNTTKCVCVHSSTAKLCSYPSTSIWI